MIRRNINKVREAIISGATAGRKGFSDKSRDKSPSGTNEESSRTLSRWQTGWRARSARPVVRSSRTSSRARNHEGSLVRERRMRKIVQTYNRAARAKRTHWGFDPSKRFESLKIDFMNERLKILTVISG